MAGDSFYTMTPGSAVADSLEDILARRKADARQAMLDSLTQQNMQHGWKNQDDQLALQRDEFASQDTARQAGFVNDEADPSTFSPKIHDFMKGVGRIRPGVASVSSQVLDENGNVVAQDPTTKEPMANGGEVYTGSNEYQAEQRHRHEMGELLDPSLGFDKLTPLQKAVMGAQHGVQFPAQLLDKGRVMYIDPVTKKVTYYDKGINDQPIEGNYPPQGVQQSYSWAGNAQDGSPIFLGSRPDGQGKPVAFNNGQPYTGNINPKPTTGGSKLVVPPMLRDRLIKAYAMGGSNGRTQVAATVNEILSTYPVPPEIKLTAIQALAELKDHPEVSTEQALAMQQNLSPEQKTQLLDILIALRDVRQ